MRALCRLAIAKHKDGVVVYRAKEVSSPRSESENIIDKMFDPTSLLRELQNNIGTDSALGLPAGPNSGLSIKFSK